MHRRLAATFDVIDDIAVAARDGTLVRTGNLTLYYAEQLGPLVELLYLKRHAPDAYRSVHLESSPIVSPLQTALRTGAITGTRYGSTVGLMPLARRRPLAEDQTEWHLWCSRGQQAAEAVAFPKGFAQGLIGALQEMEDNVHQHSGAATTGFVGFTATEGRFEFVVADAGIGVSSSLRQSEEFQHVRDAGEALYLALTDGVSRFGRDANRGFGFRTVFRSLVGRHGSLRFRSDDYALLMDGETPDLGIARLSQKPRLSGLIVSIACRLETLTRRTASS